MDIELIAGRIESTIAVHKEWHRPICIAFAYREAVLGIEGIHFRIGCSHFPIFVDREFAACYVDGADPLQSRARLAIKRHCRMVSIIIFHSRLIEFVYILVCRIKLAAVHSVGRCFRKSARFDTSDTPIFRNGNSTDIRRTSSHCRCRDISIGGNISFGLDSAVSLYVSFIVDAESRIVIGAADPEAILREGIVRPLTIAYKESLRRLRRRLFCCRIVCSSGFCCHGNGGRSHDPGLYCLSLADLLIFSRMVKDIPQHLLLGIRRLRLLGIRRSYHGKRKCPRH